MLEEAPLVNRNSARVVQNRFLLLHFATCTFRGAMSREQVLVPWGIPLVGPPSFPTTATRIGSLPGVRENTSPRVPMAGLLCVFNSPRVGIAMELLSSATPRGTGHIGTPVAPLVWEFLGEVEKVGEEDRVEIGRVRLVFSVVVVTTDRKSTRPTCVKTKSSHRLGL